MTPATTLYVRFGVHEVAFRSDAWDLLDSLRQSFRHMLGSGEGTVVGTVELHRADDRIVGQGPTGTFQGEPSAPEAILRWARYQALERLVASRPDLLWLHGAAAGYRGRAVIMPGQAGRGKSTLVTGLCRRGWTFLTDDIMPVVPETLAVHPFPQSAAVRPDPGEDQPDSWLWRVAKAEIPLDDRIARDPLPPGAVVIPDARRGGTTDLTPCPPSEAALELARGCWNFAEHGERAIGIMARVVTRVPTFRLGFRDGDEAVERLAGWADQAWSPE